MKLTSAQVVGALQGTPDGKPSRINISRPCYDKPHRCPGWAGGGCLSARESRCTEKGGYVETRPRWVVDIDNLFPEGGYGDSHPGSNQWRFGRCGECGLRTWPYVVRWTSPRYWVSWRLGSWWRHRPRWRHYRIQQGRAWRIGRRDTDWWEIVLGRRCWTNMPDWYGEDSYR